MKAKLLTALMVATLSMPIQATSKVATCKISSMNEILFKGKCLFHSEKGGSFALTSLHDQGYLFDDLIVLNVSIIEKGVAEVRGVRAETGISSRWGTAIRSKTQRACWEGADFQICAW